MKKVLLLGSGRMAGPFLDYFTNKDLHIVIASNVRSELAAMTSRFENTRSVSLDVTDPQSETQFRDLIRASQLVVSLVPAQLCAAVAELCIDERRPCLTASYASDHMKSLDQRARDADVLILNEMGLDPGIDHMLAQKCFDEVSRGGGHVISYKSYCGGIPAPEVDMTGNPLKYKLSWAPATALTANVRPAQFLQDGKEVKVPAGGHVLDHVTDMDPVIPDVEMEGIPNGNALLYQRLYSGADKASTFIRGSIRYKGYSVAMQSLVQLGLIDTKPHPALQSAGSDITWRTVLCHVLGLPDDTSRDQLRSRVDEVLGHEPIKLHAVEELGLLSDTVVSGGNSPLDVLADYLETKLAYGAGERDLVVLRNVTEIQWLSTRELRDDQMVVYGDTDGYSAMAKCVGYTIAIAAKMILEGEVKARGVVLPLEKDIYEPVLEQLSQLGLSAVRVRQTFSDH